MFEQFENQRKKLLKEGSIIQLSDFGAGGNQDKSRKISDIAKSALCPPKYCRFLHHLIKHYQYNSVLELGTSLGISGLYLSSAAEQFTSIEGDPEILKIARQVHSQFSILNSQFIEGEFDKVLPEFLSKTESMDLVYIDGNHRKIPTLNYLEMIKPKLSENGMLVLDDIYWSREMTEAWNVAKMDGDFELSIDLWRMGILVKRPGMEKQNFILRV